MTFKTGVDIENFYIEQIAYYCFDNKIIGKFIHIMENSTTEYEKKETLKIQHNTFPLIDKALFDFSKSEKQESIKNFLADTTVLKKEHIILMLLFIDSINTILTPDIINNILKLFQNKECMEIIKSIIQRFFVYS